MALMSHYCTCNVEAKIGDGVLDCYRGRLGSLFCTGIFGAFFGFIISFVIVSSLIYGWGTFYIDYFAVSAILIIITYYILKNHNKLSNHTKYKTQHSIK